MKCQIIQYDQNNPGRIYKSSIIFDSIKEAEDEFKTWFDNETDEFEMLCKENDITITYDNEDYFIYQYPQYPKNFRRYDWDGRITEIVAYNKK